MNKKIAVAVGFNPPKGILFIVTHFGSEPKNKFQGFQSPEGDSLHCHRVL